MSKNLLVFVQNLDDNYALLQKTLNSVEVPVGWSAAFCLLVSKGYPELPGFESIRMDSKTNTLVQMNQLVKTRQADAVMVLSAGDWYAPGSIPALIAAIEDGTTAAYGNSCKSTLFGTPLRPIIHPPVNPTFFKLFNPVMRFGIFNVAAWKASSQGNAGPFDVDGTYIGTSRALVTALSERGPAAMVHVPEAVQYWHEYPYKTEQGNQAFAANRIPYSETNFIDVMNSGLMHTKTVEANGLPTMYSSLTKRMPRIGLVIRGVKDHESFHGHFNDNELLSYFDNYAGIHVLSDVPMVLPTGMKAHATDNDVSSINEIMQSGEYEYLAIVHVDVRYNFDRHMIIADMIGAMEINGSLIAGMREFVKHSHRAQVCREIDQTNGIKLLPIGHQLSGIPHGPFGMFAYPHNVSVLNEGFVLVRCGPSIPVFQPSLPNLFLQAYCVMNPGKVVYAPAGIYSWDSHKPGSVPHAEFAEFSSHVPAGTQYTYYSRDMFEAYKGTEL